MYDFLPLQASNRCTFLYNYYTSDISIGQLWSVIHITIRTIRTCINMYFPNNGLLPLQLTWLQIHSHIYKDLSSLDDFFSVHSCALKDICIGKKISPNKSTLISLRSLFFWSARILLISLCISIAFFSSSDKQQVHVV